MKRDEYDRQRGDHGADARSRLQQAKLKGLNMQDIRANGRKQGHSAPKENREQIEGDGPDDQFVLKYKTYAFTDLRDGRLTRNGNGRNMPVGDGGINEKGKQQHKSIQDEYLRNP